MLANLGLGGGRLESVVALPAAALADFGPVALAAVAAALPAAAATAVAVRQARCKIAAGAAAAAGAVASPRAAGPVAPVAVVVAAAAAAVVGLRLRQFAPGAPSVRGLVLECSVLAGAVRLHLVALRKTNAAARRGAGLADPLPSQLARGLPTVKKAKAWTWHFWQKQNCLFEPKLGIST